MNLPFEARRSLLIYNLFFPLAFFCMLPGLLLRLIRRGNYQNCFGQRFGFYSREVRARLRPSESGGGRIWIQSISVGETMVALKLAKKIKALHPDSKLVISATTSTGFALAAGHQSDWLEIIYNPVDVPLFVRRALGLIAPSRLIIIEGMWPNLLAMTRELGTPASLIARLSPRSEARFIQFRWLTGPIFRLLNQIFLQEPEDIPRWEQLGAARSQLHCIGGIKFDLETADASRAAEFRQLLNTAGIAPGSPILLAGSTFAGEEFQLCRILKGLRQAIPDLLLILVPRHVERSGEILQELAPLGLKILLRSELALWRPEGLGTDTLAGNLGTGDLGGDIGDRHFGDKPREERRRPPLDCLLVNTTGELRDWYHLATVAFIGKSLCSHGGQNPVEPAAIGKPVLFGPNMENFRAIVRSLLEHRAAIQVRDAEDLQTQLRHLLTNDGLRQEIAANALRAVTPHQGATERCVEQLLGNSLLPQK